MFITGGHKGYRVLKYFNMQIRIFNKQWILQIVIYCRIFLAGRDNVSQWCIFLNGKSLGDLKKKPDMDDRAIACL